MILGASVIAVSAVLLSVRFFFQEEGASVIVQKDAAVYGTYPLSKNQEVEIGDGNRIEIQDGEVRMVYSGCPDHLCEYQGAISRDGEMIVCLPNRVVVQIDDESQEDDDLPDVIAN